MKEGPKSKAALLLEALLAPLGAQGVIPAYRDLLVKNGSDPNQWDMSVTVHPTENIDGTLEGYPENVDALEEVDCELRHTVIGTAPYRVTLVAGQGEVTIRAYGSSLPVMDNLPLLLVAVGLALHKQRAAHNEPT